MTAVPLIVTAEWLREALVNGSGNLIVLDSTWFPHVQMEGVPESSGQELYESEHIQGAQFFNLDACVTKTKLIPRGLPEPTSFQQYVRSLGISADSHVVCYDRDDGDKMISAGGSRACFTLKLYGHDNVSILDGGLVNWLAKGYETEEGPQRITSEAGSFRVNFHEEILIDYDAMLHTEESGDHQIVDMRLPINFNGEEAEPCMFTKLAISDAKFDPPGDNDMSIGHMSNAINIPFPSLYTDMIFFKEKEDLKKLFQDAGVDLSKPAIVLCYIGHTAAIWYLLAKYCGIKDVQFYPGSWTEYAQRKAGC